MYTVLFIEDDLVDQMAAMRVLKKAKLDLQIHKVNNVEEALHLLKDLRFDLVISDYHLADGTATDLAEFIQNIPFILITGLRKEELIHQAKFLGATKFIRKDQTLQYLNDLPDIIQEILPNKNNKNNAPKNEIPIAKPLHKYQIDLSKLSALFDNNKEAIAEIVHTFLTQNPIDLQQLKQELQLKNLEGIKKIVHKIKSRYNMFGLKDQAFIAATIEDQISKNQFSLDEITLKINILQDSAQAIYQSLKKHLLS